MIVIECLINCVHIMLLQEHCSTLGYPDIDSDNIALSSRWFEPIPSPEVLLVRTCDFDGGNLNDDCEAAEAPTADTTYYIAVMCKGMAMETKMCMAHFCLKCKTPFETIIYRMKDIQ